MNLHHVDWSSLPRPVDDGEAKHLKGAKLPELVLESTDPGLFNVARQSGRMLLYVYPMTGLPDKPLPHGWDAIPGARGCTPQACSFRDNANELQRLGVKHIFGVSTQTISEQRETVQRLHLPFALLSDSQLRLVNNLRLPTFAIRDRVFAKRLTLVVDTGVITKVFYPVFPPDEHPRRLVRWLQHEAHKEKADR